MLISEIGQERRRGYRRNLLQASKGHQNNGTSPRNQEKRRHARQWKAIQHHLEFVRHELVIIVEFELFLQFRLKHVRFEQLLHRDRVDIGE